MLNFSEKGNLFDMERYIPFCYKKLRWNLQLQSEVQINPQDYNVQINPHVSNVSGNVFIVLQMS